jgi:hypothetical protein
MVRRLVKDLLPWMLLIFFFVLGIALAFTIGRELRHGGSPPPSAVSASDDSTSSSQ